MIDLPPPTDLGFPPKFHDWREEQLMGIEKILDNPKRFTGPVMPTGSGKGLTYVAAALLHSAVKRVLFLTSTKGLQDQNQKDFSSMGLIDIRGQRNYPCHAVEPEGELEHLSRGSHLTWHGCDEGPCHAGVHCSLAPDRSLPHIRPKCTYYGAVWEARKKELVQSNYAYHMASTIYGQGLGTFDMLVLDEAHEAMKELENFLTFPLTREDALQIKSTLPLSDELLDWRQWARAHLGHAQDAVVGWRVTSHEDLRAFKRLKGITTRLERLSTLDPDEWVLERDDKGNRVVLSPIKVARYAEEYLFQGIPHLVLTSATLTAKTFGLLGVEPKDYLLWECPSRFPPTRRPVIHVATYPPVRVDHHMLEGHHTLWRIRIDNLIRPRIVLGRKGIIHTVSYKRMKFLLQHSEFRRQMIAHDSDHTRSAVEKFKSAPPGAILVSPSVTTGWDFPDTDCRYQIIGKVPFPDTRGAIMTVRKEQDPEFIPYLVVQMLEQAAGRGMRSMADWCETLIVDDNIEWFMKKYRHLFLRWYLDAYRVSTSVPKPLEIAT